ncbi:MAG TPA: DUF1800 domain-containing protein [Blastocatellia bacterium]|nr:DUF1800 domain-containing protein [Blastocatellia bacterium]
MASLTYAEAAHLLRRAGFGGPPQEINQLVALGRENAVDLLVDYELVNNKEFDKALGRGFNVKRPSPLEMQSLWVARMMLTRRPFEEKMTLFWHNHFATSYTKVFFSLMHVQNNVLRQHAVDRFDTLLLKVSQDAAMLIWLDGITNVVGSPNENFARELQELFTMGINDEVTGEPNYTEKDVKEIARAFTGWKFKLKKQDVFKPAFLFIPSQHDSTAKEIYGQTASFTGEDVITVICARRATGRHLVKRFFEFFVYPLADSPEDKATIEKFADVYFARDHSVKELARAIFASDEFFSERARFGLVKNPAELLVGAARMLGAGYSLQGRETADFFSLFFLNQMGMELFNPPNVSGWALHARWLMTSTLLQRFNFAGFLADSRPSVPPLRGPTISDEVVRGLAAPTAAGTVENMLSRLGPLEVDDEAKRILSDYLQTDDQGNRIEFMVNDETLRKYVRGLLHMVLCMQEFQLN